ncbi:MAG: TRAP transporter substrate-binding protein [Pleomorphochaeta sp.]
MKKGFLLLGIVLFACLPLMANGQQESSSDSVEPITMKIGHSFSVDTARHQALSLFEKNVEERSGGRIDVELYPSSELGTEMQMLEAIKMNSLEGLQCGPFEDASPQLLVFTMPFLFSDMEQVHKVTRSDYVADLVKCTEANGIKVLAVGDSGEFRQFTNNVRPIEEPADLEGLKIRTPPMDSIIKIVGTLGGNPVSIPFSELYMALKTGVADGQENPFTNIESKKLYEVQKYLSVVNYQYHAEMLYVPLDWYNSLDADLQEILVDCAHESMLLNDELLAGDSKTAYDVLSSKMIVNTISDAQRDVFIEACEPVYDYYIEEGVITQEELDEIRRIANN